MGSVIAINQARELLHALYPATEINEHCNNYILGICFTRPYCSIGVFHSVHLAIPDRRNHSPPWTCGLNQYCRQNFSFVTEWLFLMKEKKNIEQCMLLLRPLTAEICAVCEKAIKESHYYTNEQKVHQH